MGAWSKTPPDAPGFWWMRSEAGRASVVHVVDRGELRLELAGLEDDSALGALSFQGVEWQGPLELPPSWCVGEPTAPGWYFVRSETLLTIAYLFRPWADDPVLWVATAGRREQPLRRARFAACNWAGPLSPDA